jgi:hypothetical protein
MKMLSDTTIYICTTLNIPTVKVLLNVPSGNAWSPRSIYEAEE